MSYIAPVLCSGCIREWPLTFPNECFPRQWALIHCASFKCDYSDAFHYSDRRWTPLFHWGPFRWMSSETVSLIAKRLDRVTQEQLDAVSMMLALYCDQPAFPRGQNITTKANELMLEMIGVNA